MQADQVCLFKYLAGFGEFESFPAWMFLLATGRGEDTGTQQVAEFGDGFSNSTIADDAYCQLRQLNGCLMPVGKEGGVYPVFLVDRGSMSANVICELKDEGQG